MAVVEYFSTVAAAPATYACRIPHANKSNECEQVERGGTYSVLPRGVSKDLRLWGVLPREVELGRVLVWAIMGNIKGRVAFRTSGLFSRLHYHWRGYFLVYLREPGKLHLLHSLR